MKFLKEDYKEFYFKYPIKYLSYRKNLWDKIHEYKLTVEDDYESFKIIGDRESLLKFVDDLSLDIASEDLHLKEALKEDIDPRANDTDDLYAVWLPYVGKRILNYFEMVRLLEDLLKDVKEHRSHPGQGLAYRCIQMISQDGPLRVTERSNQDFLNNLDWKD